MDWIVLSLDVSASSTGWCIMTPDNGDYNIIKTTPKLNRSERLHLFREELTLVLKTFKPTHVVIEDNFSKINVATLKMLAEFAGVAKECCQDILKIDPYVMSNNTVKSFFKVRKKDELFEVMIDILDFEDKGLTFKKDNDIIDSIAQCMCYIHTVLGKRVFRKKTEYGFIYNNKGEQHGKGD